VDAEHATRSFVFTFLALLMPLIFFRTAHAAKFQQLDLRKNLCDLSAQQPNNDPMAGVEFLSEDEVVVYTVCNTGEPTLSRRDDPDAPSPNHLKAVVLDVATGVVKQRFDWPTHSRGAMVRATHAGDLLVVRDNLLEVLDPGGKALAALRIPKVSPADMTFVGLSPATDTVVVTESSERPDGKTVNGVAVLDSKSLDPIAQFHDDGDSWNIAATRTTAVRTSESDSRVQLRELKDGNLAKGDWKTVWPHSRTSIPRPLFLSDSEFLFPAENSIQLLTVAGKAQDKLDCENAVKAAVSRSGEFLAAACIPINSVTDLILAGRRRVAGGGGYRPSEEAGNPVTITVYEGPPFHRIFDDFSASMGPGFDFALSPSGTRLAVVDRLALSVFNIP
jgi:hypothetical protein